MPDDSCTTPIEPPWRMAHGLLSDTFLCRCSHALLFPSAVNELPPIARPEHSDPFILDRIQSRRAWRWLGMASSHGRLRVVSSVWREASQAHAFAHSYVWATKETRRVSMHLPPLAWTRCCCFYPHIIHEAKWTSKKSWPLSVNTTIMAGGASPAPTLIGRCPSHNHPWWRACTPKCGLTISRECPQFLMHRALGGTLLSWMGPYRRLTRALATPHTAYM